jgi:hypothetical protein
MKAFLRRLRIFGVGFGIGLIFVFFFFQNRGCTWLPENRIKNDILGRVLTVSDENETLLRKKGLSTKEIVSFLNDGDVIMSGSKRAGNPRVYQIVKTVKGKEISLWFTLPNKSFITEILLPKGNIQQYTITKKGFGKFISFPKEKGKEVEIVFIDHNETFDKQLFFSGISNEKQLFTSIKKSAKLDFEKSSILTKKEPQHVLEFSTLKKAKIHATTEWFQDKIVFDGFEDFELK